MKREQRQKDISNGDPLPPSGCTAYFTRLLPVFAASAMIELPHAEQATPATALQTPPHD
jgi:hypothetical protein